MQSVLGPVGLLFPASLDNFVYNFPGWNTLGNPAPGNNLLATLCTAGPCSAALGPAGVCARLVWRRRFASCRRRTHTSVLRLGRSSCSYTTWLLPSRYRARPADKITSAFSEPSAVAPDVGVNSLRIADPYARSQVRANRAWFCQATCSTWPRSFGRRQGSDPEKYLKI